MANDYFNHVANRVQAGTRAIAANVNSVADEIATGLDKLPTENELKLGLTRYAVDTGVADAYVLTMPYVPTLTDGFNLTFKAVNANTGASTLNVNATGVKSIVNPDGSALIANTFSNNAIIIVAYESVNDRFILVSQNPAQSALAQASAAAAAISESNAATSESNAATSESNASTSASNASTSETNAATSESNAAADEASTAALYDQFDDRYLGDKASDPTLDNDGNPLLTGAIYFNTTSNQMKVYDGASWLFFQDGGNAATITLADESADTLTYLVYANNATGNEPLKTGTNLTFNSSTGALTATSFTGDLTGTVLTAAQANITSLGTLTNLDVDNINLNGNTIVATGNLTVGGIFINDDATTGGQIQMTANSALTTGELLILNNTVGTFTGRMIELTQNSAGSTAVPLYISQTGANVALDIVSTVNNASLRVTNNTATTQPAANIVGNGVTTGHVLDISSSGASMTGGGGIRVNITGGTDVFANSILAIMAGNGDAIEAQANSAASTAIRAYSNTASRTQPVMEVIHDSATGTGKALYVQQDATALALEVVGGYSEIEDLRLQEYNETANSFSITTGTKDLDLTTGTYFYAAAAMTAVAYTFTFSSPAASGRVSSFTLELINPGTASSITWPAAVDWDGGIEPVWTTTGTDIVSFVTRDGGTTWLGFLGAQDIK